MTVASLWKALDRAECGKAVGVTELLDHHRLKEGITPWNHNERSKLIRRPALAIDLSIWICESLTSSAIGENHAEPALHLVYSRTLKLLNLGVKVIAVIEGKRRIRQSDGGDDQFQKRRSGGNFWRACQRCEDMLSMLGVPVVRAKAEGEALCALLNEKGIVDGVISNDGDCFLFGAKVLYTKFTIENLRLGKVMRYDASDIQAFIDDDDSDEYDKKASKTPNQTTSDIVTLGRKDLVAFAILTGSDVAGDGLPQVGCRKALRFIRKCQIDNPLRPQQAAMREMISWANTARMDIGVSTACGSSSKCSMCCHAGTKRSHTQHGCKLCGTNPGESCYQLSPGGKFRNSLRAKALGMVPKFSPQSIVDVYGSPNDNQVPLIFNGKTSQDLGMKPPDLQSLLHSNFIIRGRGYTESKEYVMQSISRLIARSELFQLSCAIPASISHPKLPRNRNKPEPTRIIKKATRSRVPCFEIQWLVNASMTDSSGKPINDFKFTTVEEEAVIQKCYPELVDRFHEDEKERLKQGAAEQERRKAFLKAMVNHHGSGDPKKHLDNRPTQKLGRNRRSFFSKGEDILLARGSTSNEHVFRMSVPGSLGQKEPSSKFCSTAAMGDDANLLLRFVDPRGKEGIFNDDQDETIESSSDLSTIESNLGSPFEENSTSRARKCSSYKSTLTPGHVHFLGYHKLPIRPETRGPTFPVVDVKKMKSFVSLERGAISCRAANIGIDAAYCSPDLKRSCRHHEHEHVMHSPVLWNATTEPFEKECSIERNTLPSGFKTYGNQELIRPRNMNHVHTLRGNEEAFEATESVSFDFDNKHSASLRHDRGVEDISIDPLRHFHVASPAKTPEKYDAEGLLMNYLGAKPLFDEKYEPVSLPLFNEGGASRERANHYDMPNDCSILADSIADLSIQSIKPFRTPTFRDRYTSADKSPDLQQLERSHDFMLGDTFPEDSLMNSPLRLFHESHDRRPLDAYDLNLECEYPHDCNIVDAAMAKLEHKSRLAKKDHEHVDFLREVIWEKLVM